MNFIKKKLKGHKKDDEEEEYEKAVCEQSLRNPTGEERVKNSEEWQFFNQLSMKVQDTVQKTQTSLNKLKDNRQDNLSGEEDRDLYNTASFLDSELSSQDLMTDPFGTPKMVKAPPRPPPPGGDKSWVPVDSDSESDFMQSMPSKLPPRPPPPGIDKFSDQQFGLETSASYGGTTRNFPSPARPPPPNTMKPSIPIGEIQSSFSITSQPLSKSENQTDKSLSLLEEFGFQTEVPVSTVDKTNFQDLLFLEEKEEVDPFDTSFVDVSNISNIDANTKMSVTGEQNYNPFSSSSDSAAISSSWGNAQEIIEGATNKTSTNPFFLGTFTQSENTDIEDESNAQPWCSSNPFSESQQLENKISSDDLLSDVPLISSFKSSIIGDTFQKNEQSLMASLKRDSENDLLTSCVVAKVDDIFGLEIDPHPLVMPDKILDTNKTKDAFDTNHSWPTEEMNIEPITEDLKDNLIVSNDFSAKQDSSLLWNSCETKAEDTILAFPDVTTDETEVKVSDDTCSVPVVENNKNGKTSSNILDDFFGNDMVASTVAPCADPFESISSLPVHISESLSSNDDLKVVETIHHDLELSTERSDTFDNISDDNQVKEISDLNSMNTNMKLDLASDIMKESPSAESVAPVAAEPIVPVTAEPIVPVTAEPIVPVTAEPIVPVTAEPIALVTAEPIAPVKEVMSQPFDDEDQFSAFAFKIKKTEDKPDLDFDAFAAKFACVKDKSESDPFDAFITKKAPTLKKLQEANLGFGSMDEFDPFKVSSNAEFVKSSNGMKKEASRDSFEEYDNESSDFSVVIKPKVRDVSNVDHLISEAPKLLPPPKTPTKAFDNTAPRFNPFDKDYVESSEQISEFVSKGLETLEIEEEAVPALGEAGIRKSDSQESPLSPLFDEDTSQPLEVFPKPFEKEGWEMVLRQPNKKKLTGNRFWKKIFVKLSENSVLQLFNKQDDKVPFQELPLQACYSLSEVGAQQYDQYGKIFTVKLQYKFYRERVGVRPGQIAKVTQGQVTSMGDVAKLGLPLQHSPQTSQLLKIGTHSYKDIKLFIQVIEDALFRMVVHRDRVLTYKTEEIQVIAQDEFYVEQNKVGHVEKQLACVRVFFLAFVTGMPTVEVGLNDIERQGKEVVGRYDIIPVVTEEWIRLEDCEFHSCVVQDEFYKNRVIKFQPPDACLFELLQFRIRPPKNRELPLQVRVFMSVSNSRVEIRSDILVPGYSSRKQGQIPCENIQIRFPVPECWIYLFRTEKHFRYGSKKSTSRRPGKIKGLERIIGAAQNLDASLIEVSAGQAKYEHVFHAVVWRIPRLPKEGQGAYTQQLFLLRTELTSFDQIPESFEQYVDVEFTMPATYVSHTTVRSVSVTNPNPPEKYVRYISKHEYKVEIEFKSGTDDIDGLISSSSVGAPVVSTTPAVQESTEDEKEEDDSD